MQFNPFPLFQSDEYLYNNLKNNAPLFLNMVTKIIAMHINIYKWLLELWAMKHSACFSTWRPPFAIKGVKWVNLNQIWISFVEVHYFLQVTEQPPGSEPTQMTDVTFQLLITTSVPSQK